MSDSPNIRKLERISALMRNPNSGMGTAELADKMSKHGLEVSSLILKRVYIPIYHAYFFCQSFKKRLNGIEPLPINITFDNFCLKLSKFGGEKYAISSELNDHSVLINKWLGKGVHKSNDVPLMFVVFDNELRERKTEDGDKIQHCIIEKNDLVKLNKKNLMKFYNYSDSDASAFIKNIGMARNNGYSIREIRILLPEKTQSLDWLMIASNFNSNGLLVNSWMNLYLMEDNLKYNDETDKNPLEHAMNSMRYIEFVDYELFFWKDVTEDWLKKYRPHFKDFNSLEKFERDRHIVNSIRHNAINYVLSWLALDEELHDAIFCLVNRKIANTFPTLRREAIRQIEERDYKF
ncbi:hypothetical protein [Aeromonas veronii]|uniref:hypothetical protein n=1 Tax=Aeromonas veronii TaxID=654 RepID=UPI00224661E2|nr:hypothetical protein [Aeromonas veronii]MCX0443391.1 hypothetical protein [Aeromonas veronii]